MKEHKKRITSVDILFSLGAILVSAGIGIGLGLAAGVTVSGVFLLIGSWLSDDSKTRKGGGE